MPTIELGDILVSTVPAPYERNPEHEELGEECRRESDMANVMVMGGPDTDAHGLDESLAEFRTHHKDVGEKLLNLSGVGTVDGQPHKITDVRPQYEHEDYPFMLYKPGEDEPVTVRNAAEKAEYMSKGWRVEPVAKPQVAVLDPATEKRMLLDANKAQQAQISTQGEIIAKLTERLDAIESVGRSKKA